MFNWMAWTLPTASFFIIIAVLLVGMTVWEILQPTTERKGWMPIATTRGDRLFIGLLSSAFIHLAIVGFSDLDISWALAGSVAWLITLMRWG